MRSIKVLLIGLVMAASVLYAENTPVKNGDIMWSFGGGITAVLSGYNAKTDTIVTGRKDECILRTLGFSLEPFSLAYFVTDWLALGLAFSFTYDTIEKPHSDILSEYKVKASAIEATTFSSISMYSFRIAPLIDFVYAFEQVTISLGLKPGVRLINVNSNTKACFNLGAILAIKYYPTEQFGIGPYVQYDFTASSYSKRTKPAVDDVYPTLSSGGDIDKSYSHHFSAGLVGSLSF